MLILSPNFNMVGEGLFVLQFPLFISTFFIVIESFFDVMSTIFNPSPGHAGLSLLEMLNSTFSAFAWLFKVAIRIAASIDMIFFI